ncbi:MAG: hypothetical protein JWM93_3769 [Frankiales bacterium]|nr:hypothetical protein [Frankiales bacterium]
MPITRVRAGDVVAVREFLAAREPRTTELLAPIRERGLSRHVRAWAVRAADGSLCGVITNVRWVLDRWYAHVHLDDLSLAPEVGTFLQGRNIRSVLALEDTMRAISPHLPRVRKTRRYWCIFGPPQEPKSDIEVIRTALEGVELRAAVPSDIGQVGAVYLNWVSAVNNAPVHRTFRVLKRLVAKGAILVAVEDGTITGVIMNRPRTDTYEIIDGHVVRSPLKASGVGMALAAYSSALAFSEGRGVFSLRVSRSRVKYPGLDAQHGEPFAFLMVALHPLSRFRGHRRLIGLVEKAETALFRPARGA